MKLHAFTLAIVLAGFAGVAGAGQPGANIKSVDAVELLSRATGLTIHEVDVALGPSTEAYDHATGYERVNRRFRQAVGRALYEQVTGEGKLTTQQVQDLVAMARIREAAQAARAVASVPSRQRGTR